MLFALYCRDRADGLETRLANRDDHIAWALESGMLRMAGPLLADDGETMIGSLLVIEAEDLEAARRFSAADPYVRAGLFERVEIHPFRWLLGEGPGADT